MQSSDLVISNVFGVLGAICWSTQLLPQIILNCRRHSAAGLSPTFMLFWACAGLPLGVYNVVRDFNLALQIQPQILTCLSLVTWAQVRHYERQRSLRNVSCSALLLAASMGGLETALVVAVRTAVRNGIDWPLTLMAILAAIFLAVGVLEQYLAIWRTRSVEGISFLFCGIDALGDVTSIVSVCFEPHISVLGLVTYALELLLWIGIFACGAYLAFVPWLWSLRERSRAQPRPDQGGEAAVTLQDLPSSTSVFHTPEGTVEVRSRRPHLPS